MHLIKVVLREWGSTIISRMWMLIRMTIGWGHRSIVDRLLRRWVGWSVFIFASGCQSLFWFIRRFFFFVFIQMTVVAFLTVLALSISSPVKTVSILLGRVRIRLSLFRLVGSMVNRRGLRFTDFIDIRLRLERYLRWLYSSINLIDHVLVGLRLFSLDMLYHEHTSH